MNLEPEADDLVGNVGEDNAIKYSIAISLKRIADNLGNINDRQRNGELTEIDLAGIKARFLKGLE